MLCLGVILYLAAKALPRIDDRNPPPREILKTHWIVGYLEKIDEFMKARLEKILRRLKIWLLKLDNYVSGKLERFKKEALKETKLPIEEADINRKDE